MAIAQNIVNIAVAAAEKEGARRVTRVNVVAGELRGLISIQLTYCFGLMAENTMASGAQLGLEIVPVMGRCKRCEETFTVKDYRLCMSQMPKRRHTNFKRYGASSKRC